MPPFRFDLLNRKLKARVGLSFDGEYDGMTSCAATLDTGATDTCVPSSLIAIEKPDFVGDYYLSKTASGIVFTRSYLLFLHLGKDIAQRISASVLFEPKAVGDFDFEVDAKLAELLEEGEREKFTLGDSNQLIVNLREEATADAAVRQFDALADYRQSLATLQAAIGSSD